MTTGNIAIWNLWGVQAHFMTCVHLETITGIRYVMYMASLASWSCSFKNQVWHGNHLRSEDGGGWNVAIQVGIYGPLGKRYPTKEGYGRGPSWLCDLLYIYIYIHCFLHVRIGYIAIIRVLCSPFLVQHRRIPHSERCLSFSLSCHARPRPPELQKSSKKWRVTLVSRDDILGRLRLPY